MKLFLNLVFERTEYQANYFQCFQLFLIILLNFLLHKSEQLHKYLVWYKYLYKLLLLHRLTSYLYFVKKHFLPLTKLLAIISYIANGDVVNYEQ